jgi:hypothetical protein
MWLFLHRVLSRSCTCLAVASAKLSFGINANSDGILDIAALASLASHSCTVTLQVISTIFPHNFFKDNSDVATRLNAPDQLHPVKAGASRHRFAASGLDWLPLVRPGARMPLSGNSPAEPGKLKNFPVRVPEQYWLFAKIVRGVMLYTCAVPRPNPVRKSR